MKQVEKETKDPDSRYVIESVIKSLHVLFAFRNQPYRFTISELEQFMSLPKNQIFRSLKSLEEFGLLRIDGQGYYVVTQMIYQLTPAADYDDAPLEEIAQPIMERLQVTTEETINLCCLVEGQSVIVARKHSKQGIRLMTILGHRTLLHSGASPKAMLAFLPKEEQEQVLTMLPHYIKYTEYTVTDSDKLRLELEEIRQRGYSISDEDFEMGACGVGAPIFDITGRVIAGISAGGPSSRVDEARLHQMGPLVIDAAKQISRYMGHY